MSLGPLMRKKLVNSNNKYLFFYPGNINQKTGGYIYEKNILTYSKNKNFPIKFISLSDNYPYPSSSDLNELIKIINKENSKTTLIFDGLVYEGILKFDRTFFFPDGHRFSKKTVGKEKIGKSEIYISSKVVKGFDQSDTAVPAPGRETPTAHFITLKTKKDY